jgi:hypothetical protein
MINNMTNCSVFLVAKCSFEGEIVRESSTLTVNSYAYEEKSYDSQTTTLSRDTVRLGT